MTQPSFYWHDYETFGTDPRRDRPSQFAGLRTDYDFNVAGEPFVIYCKVPEDYLPQPEACLITGITPQIANKKGVCEAEFIALIRQQMSQSRTCSLGYNNIRFDDEVTRNALYRNLYDPYEREWQNGNSRWDLIDIVRAAYALRPQGIEWPKTDEGVPIFKLEALTQANGIEHLSAHDALSDVYATIAIAKLIKTAQPKLYDFLFQHRIKSEVLKLLELGQFKAVVHISGKYSARNNCIAIVLPICEHPTNSNGVIVYDLSYDPEEMLSLSVEEIKQRVFTSSEQLPDGVTRIPLKTVHVNKCPVLAPVKVIKPEDAARLKINWSECINHLEKIKKSKLIIKNIADAFNAQFDDQNSDPDLMIYNGGFFNSSDKKEMAKVHSVPFEQLRNLPLKFSDPRLDTLFFRYRARNYPETLTSEEIERWTAHCCNQFHNEQGRFELGQYLHEIDTLAAEPNHDKKILSSLKEFAKQKLNSF